MYILGSMSLYFVYELFIRSLFCLIIYICIFLGSISLSFYPNCYLGYYFLFLYDGLTFLSHEVRINFLSQNH